jgi:hypothetical protein
MNVKAIGLQNLLTAQGTSFAATKATSKVMAAQFYTHYIR